MAVYGREHYTCTYKGVALEQGETPGYRRARQAGCQSTDQTITGSEGNTLSIHLEACVIVEAVLTKFRKNRMFSFGIKAY